MPVDFLNAPIAIAFGLLSALLFGLAAQRLLGIKLGRVRLLVAGIFALTVGPQLILALVNPFLDDGGQTSDPAVFWFVLLAGVLTMLAAMVFVVVLEAFVPLGSVPPATVWGRGLIARIRRSRRYWQIVALTVRHGLGPYLRGGRARSLKSQDGRKRLGQALTRTLSAGGVTFVKLGQLLSTRRDLISSEVVTELERLQDQAEPVPWPEVEAVLIAELGGPIADTFTSVEHVPLGAASVGQVHAAQLLDGTEVVVKVQRPDIAGKVERDLDIASRFAARLELRTSWGARMGVVALADGLAGSIREELDYSIEADNLRVVRSAVSKSDSPVVIPKLYPALSTEKVLVMQRLTGEPLAKAGDIIAHRGLDRSELARTLLSALLQQITVDGIFHADPHGGNILLLEDGRLALLDFGAVGRLDASVRETLQRLLLAIDRGDPLTAADALLELVPRPDEIDDQQLERDLGRFIARYVTGGGSSGAKMFAALFRIVAHHGLAIPAEVAAVFRALATVEGTLTGLAPEFDLIKETRSLAAAQMQDKLRPDQLRQAAMDELVTLMPILRRLPRRLDRLAGAAEAGRLSVNLRLLSDGRDRAVIGGMLREVLVTVLAATTGVMAVLLLGTDGGPVVTPAVSLYALIGYNFLAISAVLALRVLVKVFRR